MRYAVSGHVPAVAFDILYFYQTREIENKKCWNLFESIRSRRHSRRNMKLQLTPIVSIIIDKPHRRMREHGLVEVLEIELR